MNGNKKMMPENCYSLDTEMSLDKIKRAKDSGNFLVAKASRWNSSKNCVDVDLGNNFKGEIPLYDFSIYTLTRPNGKLSPFVYSHIGKNICACVKEISDDNTIILSRKENMIKAFRVIEQSENNIVTCLITSISDYGLYVDLGHGINGLIHINDLILSRVNNLSDIGFKLGQLIDAKILSINSEKYQVVLNYKDLYENLSSTLKAGDIIEVLTLSPLNQCEDGYFVFINPNTPALMDPPEGIEIPYGSKVIARVKSYNSKRPDKVRLGFLSFTY